MNAIIARHAHGLADRARAEGYALLARPSSRGATIAFVAMMVTTVAHAQGTGIAGVTGGASAATMLQDIANFILGAFGQTLAVLAIIGIGLAWMFGRVSLGLIAGVIGGIIIMFGASFLASTLIGSGATG